MIAENVARISDLIERLLGRVPIDRLNDVVIFGSAAITLNGVDLQRPVDDLDLFASEDAYAELKARYAIDEVEQAPGITFLRLGVPSVEVWKSFPGVAHADVKGRAQALPCSCGLPVAALEDLRAWKQAQGRDKDLADLSRFAEIADY